jgi:hypothetical protein
MSALSQLPYLNNELDTMFPNRKMLVTSNDSKESDTTDNSMSLSSNNSQFHENFRCPLTLQYFFDPVIAKDGIVYERFAINAWFIRLNSRGKSIVSPITMANIPDTVFPCVVMKNMVNDFLKQNENEKEDQYEPNTKHKSNIEAVGAIMRSNDDYSRLRHYTDFYIGNLPKIKNDFFTTEHSTLIHFIKEVRDFSTFTNICHSLITNSRTAATQIAIMKEIKKKGIDLKSITHNGSNLLMYYCREERDVFEEVSFLLQEGFKMRTNLKQNNNNSNKFVARSLSGILISTLMMHRNPISHLTMKFNEKLIRYIILMDENDRMQKEIKIKLEFKKMVNDDYSDSDEFIDAFSQKMDEVD